MMGVNTGGVLVKFKVEFSKKEENIPNHLALPILGIYAVDTICYKRYLLILVHFCSTYNN